MQINTECPHCMNAAVITDAANSLELCPHCQKPMRIKTSLPESNVLVADARLEPQGLRFDLESMLALSAFALIVVVAVLFYMCFRV